MLLFPQLTRPDVWQEYAVDLVDALAQVDWFETSDKFAAPLFGPYQLRPGTRRANANVAAITHVALDFDGLDDTALRSVLARISAYRCVVWSTWSWGTKPGWRFRVVFNTTRAVTPAEWPQVFARLLQSFPEADAKCSDPSRVMFLPSCHPGALRWRDRFDGPPLDLDALPPAPIRVDEFTAPLPADILERLVKKWWKSNDLAKVTLAHQLKLALDGAVYAQKGDVDNSTFAIVCALVREVANAPASAIVATLKPSLELMGADAAYLEKVAGMIPRAARYVEETAEREAAPAPQATINDPKLLGYLSALNSEDPIRALCLQCDGDYWVLTTDAQNGFQYVQCKREGLVRQASDKWAKMGVRLVALTAEGKPRKLKAEEIVEAYGTPIEGVVQSFEYQEPEIRRDGARRELVLPAARRRLLEAQYNPDVDHWLSLLGGAAEETLRDWIALALDTTQPLAALMLIGARGTGKSLLAEELAKIWTTRGTPRLVRCLGDAGFNTELTRAPIVLAEEDLPRDLKGRVRSAEIRDFVQRRIHAINEKNRGMQYLEGCPRLVACANGDQILDFGAENLTCEDLAAIQERLFVLRVGPASATFLRSMPVGLWVDQDTIAKHALWLAETRAVVRHGRFGVFTGASYSPQLVNSHGLRSAILEWLVKFVLQPTRLNVRHATNGELFAIRLADVEAHWQAYVSTAKPRTDRLATASRVFPFSGDGLIVVTLGDLTSWARAANYCSRIELEHAFRGLGEAAQKGLSVVR